MNLLRDEGFLGYLDDLESQHENLARYPGILRSVMRVESRGNPAAVSPKGAAGPFQFIEKTARQYGVKNRHDPVQSAQGAARYLDYLIGRFGLQRGVAGYNTGEGNIAKGIVPSETKKYVPDVLSGLGIRSAGASEAPKTDYKSIANRAVGRMTGPAESSVAKRAVSDLSNEKYQPIAQRAIGRMTGQLKPEDAAAASEKPSGSPSTGPGAFTAGGAKTLAKMARGAAEGLQSFGKASGLSDVLPGTGTVNRLSETEKTLGEQAQGGWGKAGELAGAIPPYAALPAAAGPALAAATTPGSLPERLRAGAGAALGGLVGKGAGTMAGGFTASPQAKALMAKGVQPTVGQGISTEGGMVQQGVGRTLRRLEDSATSLPFTGRAVEYARERAASDTYRKLLDRAEVPERLMKPLYTIKGGKMVESSPGFTVPAVRAKGEGTAAVATLGDGYNEAYSSLLSGQGVPGYSQIRAQARGRAYDPKLHIPEDRRAMVESMIDQQFSQIAAAPAGIVDAAELKRGVIGDLKKMANEYSRSQMMSDRAMGRAFASAAADADQAIRKSVKGQVRSHLLTLDKHYRTFKQIERMSRPGMERVPTTAKMMEAIRQGPMYQVTRGRSLNQDLIAPAAEILPSRLGESGTAPRTWMQNLGRTLLEGGIGWQAPAASAGVLGASMLGATRPVQKALLGGYESQPGISALLKQILTPAGLGLGAGAFTDR